MFTGIAFQDQPFNRRALFVLAVLLLMVAAAGIALVVTHAAPTAIVAMQSDGTCDESDQSDEEDCADLYVQSGCAAFEPYGYWWYFFNCHPEATATSSPSSSATTISIVTLPDGRRVLIINRVIGLR